MGYLPGDDQEFEELAIAEEELIDAYVRKALPADERKLVEKGLLSSPQLAERFHFARLLAKELASIPQSQTAVSRSEAPVPLRGPKEERTPWWKGLLGSSAQPSFQMALVACVILVLLGGIPLFAGWMKLRSESRRFESERTALEQRRQELEKKSAEQQSRSEQLTAELQKEKQQLEQDEKLIEELKRSQNQNDQSKSPLASAVASLLLLPGLTRDIGGGNELIVPSGTSTIRLKLGLEANDYPSYGAAIKNAQGLEVFRQNELKARSGKLVTLQLPAQRLPPGDYTVRLSGLTSSGAAEPVSDYAFRITAKEK